VRQICALKGSKESDLTEDDQIEGLLPGDHNTLKLDQTRNSTLISRINQLLITHVRTSSSAKREIHQLQQRQLPMQSVHGSVSEIDIVLLSCSATKTDRPGVRHPEEDVLAGQFAELDVVRLALQTRSLIYTLIRSNRLFGLEHEQGNRGSRRENRSLILGPDFGGVENAEVYLPAFERYTGRCFQDVEANNWTHFFQLHVNQRPDILIMSGLYGLFPIETPIQNYDCHLTDVDMQSGRTVVDWWREVMTTMLLSRIRHLESSGLHVRRIYDFLSERSYQRAIHWERIYEFCPVFHRVFENSAGRNSLFHIGRLLQTIVGDPTRLHAWNHAEFIPIPGVADDRVAFELAINSCPLPVQRETV
jgi:Peroxide stress protein YaaA